MTLGQQDLCVSMLSQIISGANYCQLVQQQWSEFTTGLANDDFSTFCDSVLSKCRAPMPALLQLLRLGSILIAHLPHAGCPEHPTRPT